jgi:hypothetical protein
MRSGRSSVAVSIAAIALALFASGANADTYCVHRTGCDPTHTKSTVQAAFDAVSADRRAGIVLIGAGTFDETASFSGPSPVTVDGAGQLATTLSQSAAEDVLGCSSLDRMTVENLSLHAAGSNPIAGIDAGCPITVRNVAVNTEFSPTAIGIDLGTGSNIIDHTTVLSSETGPDAGAVQAVDGASLTITDSQLLGEFGLWGAGFSGAPTIVAHRLIIQASGSAAAAVWSESAHISIDDSLLEVTGGADALGAVTHLDSSTLNARQITMIGDGSTNGVYVWSTSGNPGASSTANVEDSIMRSTDGTSSGFTPFSCITYSGETVTINIDHSDFAFPSASPCGGGGTDHFNQGSHNLYNLNPMFVSPGSMDYQLQAASPVRDRDTTPLQPGESTTDLAGLPRIRGFARDLGAYEFQPPPAGASTRRADHVTRTAATVHGMLTTHDATEYWFEYGLTRRYGHRTRIVGPVSSTTPLSVSARLRGLLRNHVYHFRLVATNGLNSEGADRTFRTRR